MKKITLNIGMVFATVVLLVMPQFVLAQEEVDPGTNADLLSITTNAEQSVMNFLPQSVKDFFARTFSGVEKFRVQQVAISAAKRDELQLQIQTAQNNRDAATDENRDAVLEGESTSLYNGAGERLDSNVPIGLTVKYYAYKFYNMLVSSPILFYLLGSFIAVYIIITLFNRARKRGGE